MTQIRIHYLNETQGVIARETVAFTAGTTRRDMMFKLDHHVAANHPNGSQRGKYELGYIITTEDTACAKRSL